MTLFHNVKQGIKTHHKFQLKAIDLNSVELKTLEEKDDRYEFKGYASIFNVEDRVNDIVEPGAFKRTVDHHEGKFPLVMMHNLDVMVGGANVYEDQKGLRVDPGFLLKKINAAREGYELMKAGVVDGMSFMYWIVDDQVKGKFRHLKELAVGEITLGPSTLTAHPDALVTEVKSEWIQKHRQQFNDLFKTNDDDEIKALLESFNDTLREASKSFSG